MNSDFMWDTDHAAAMRAATHDFYQREQKEHDMHKPDSESASLIIAGVAACSLATRVLEVKWSDPEAPSTQVVVQLAKQVLDAWGLTITSAIPLDKPPVSPPATLVWPPVDRMGRPLRTSLPDVYRENYYHAHEQILTQSGDGLGAWSCEPALPLVLHEAYWNEETLTWRMQFSAPALPNRERFWVNHSQVKPGDEIPKVIDAATQARSNDP